MQSLHGQLDLVYFSLRLETAYVSLHLGLEHLVVSDIVCDVQIKLLVGRIRCLRPNVKHAGNVDHFEVRCLYVQFVLPLARNHLSASFVKLFGQHPDVEAVDLLI